jgi:hypothetical protein
MEFIRSCLATCVDTHTKICPHPIGRDPQGARDLPPRLYDIRHKKIVLGSALAVSNDTRYIALSYVWGKAVKKGIRTVSANVEKRLEGFDLTTHEDCPHTYRTAVRFAEGLGFHYIWIDSICMIQDDQSDRILHFRHFEKGVGQIYEDAHLTLCCIGDGADYNILSDRQAEPEQKSVKINFDGAPLVIMPKITQLSNLVDKPGAWGTRGWTYQEWLLSPRLAYLTPSQAFFECQTVSEECGMEALSAIGHDDRLEMSAVLWPGNDARQTLRLEKDREQLLELWPYIVQHYSTRQLSYASDRLNAIQSIGMQLILRWGRLGNITDSRDLETQLISGLLRERLHHGLLWQASPGGERILLSQWAKGKECPVPSWSWASWTGPITWEKHLRSVAVSRDRLEWLPVAALAIAVVDLGITVAKEWFGIDVWDELGKLLGIEPDLAVQNSSIISDIDEVAPINKVVTKEDKVIPTGAGLTDTKTGAARELSDGDVWDELWTALGLPPDLLVQSLLNISGTDDDSKAKVAATNDDKIVLQNARLVEVRAGKSLKLAGGYDTDVYQREIGRRSCSLNHDDRSYALKHSHTGEIIGKGIFDSEIPSEPIECLFISANLPRPNSYTKEPTESINVLLVHGTSFGYVRAGVGELFVRAGSQRTDPEPRQVEHLMLV